MENLINAAYNKIKERQHHIIDRDISVMSVEDIRNMSNLDNNNIEKEMNSMNDDRIVDELVKQAMYVNNEKTIINNNIKGEIDMDNNNNLKNGHVVVIGTGAGGGNCAHLAKQYGFANMAVNTSTDDTEKIDVDHVFIINDAFGSGKERRRSKEKFIDDSDRFIDYFNTNFSKQNTVIVVHTAGGGTGGGSAPMMAKFIKDNNPHKNVFLCSALGSIHEDVKSQANMAAVLEELIKSGVNYLVFDNNKASGSIDNVYSTVNNEIISAIRVISREYFVPNTRQNMDLTDMQKLFLDNRRMIVVSGNFNTKLTGTVDYEQQILDAIDKSTQVGTCGSSISAYGFFLNVEERLYSEMNIEFPKIKEVLGESKETFKQLQNKTSDGPDFAIIISGLDETVDRYELINRRIEEYNSRQVSSRSLSDVKKVSINDLDRRVVVPGEVKSIKQTSAGDVIKSAFADFAD